MEKGSPVPLGHALPGDKLIITKTGAIEGSFIAANEHSDKLEGKVSSEFIAEAGTYSELISVVREGTILGPLASSTGALRDDGFPRSCVDLMHDVTEGGVEGAAFEMADFSGVGVDPCRNAVIILHSNHLGIIVPHIQAYFFRCPDDRFLRA